jgi:hypothetical protein
MRKEILAIAALFIAVTLCSLTLPQPEEKAQNLKVLPRNISHDELDKVMKDFKNALGVKCGFCHAPRKDNPQKLDFASDENKHKEIARDMMRMTAKINKKYFKGHETLSVTCYTCHRGNKEPEAAPLAGGMDKK